VIDLSTLKVIRRVEPSDLAPRGLAVTFDGKYVITSNKNTSDGVVCSTPSPRLLRRIHIGERPEFIKINRAGHRLFATFEPTWEGASGSRESRRDRR
jgi:DNA-binding beta-propeller fold protein YncE